MNKKFIFPVLLIIISALVVSFAPGLKMNKEKLTGGSTAFERSKPGETGIEFIEADWNKALAEAKKQKKLVFLDAYTSWCGPCKMLKRYTFPDKAAGEFFNKNFVNVALDMEKGDGIAVANTYGVRAYPTLIITDESGKLVTLTEGYINPQQLIEFGKHGLSVREKSAK